MPSQLQELDGLLRRNGVSITPAETQGTEEISNPVGEGDDATEEKFTITMTNQRNVTGVLSVYNTRTGERRELDINQLKSEMGRVHLDPDFPAWLNKPMYTLDRDSVPKPLLGNLLCPLNPRHPDWPKYQAVGAMPCRKHTLPHELAVESHVRIKHRQTWANMQRKHDLELEEEERAYRRWQMTQGRPAVTVTASSTDGVATSFVEASRPAKPPVSAACKVCGEKVTASSRQGLVSKMRTHQRNKHSGEMAEATA